MLADCFLMLRAKQYVKNLFVVAPLFFSLSFFDIYSCVYSFLTFVAFCMVSSFVYILNDLIDIDKDRMHPIKCLRPIASGRARKKEIVSVLFILVSISLSLLYFIDNLMVNLIFLAYVLINFMYSLKLKNVAIIDVCVIALGFILRIYAGALTIDVPVSGYIVLATLSLSMFLGFSKRKMEFNNLGDSAREVMKDYSVDTLNSYIIISATLCVFSYFLYTIENNKYFNNCLIFSSLFVIYGIFRYILITDTKKIDDPTENLYEDRGLWLVCVLYVVYMTTVFIISHFE